MTIKCIFEVLEMEKENEAKTRNICQVEVLQEELTYATEEVERLTKVLVEQNSLLQASQEQTAQKEIMIQNQQLKVISSNISSKRTPNDQLIKPLNTVWYVWPDIWNITSN